MTSRTDKMSADSIRAAYMRVQVRKQLEEDNCNNVPKRTKLHGERQRGYRETHKNISAEYMHNYRKHKAQKNKTPQASTSTDPTPTQLYTVITNPMNTFKRILLVIHLVMPATCDGIWYMNDLSKYKKKTHGCCSVARVTCIAEAQ
jgi:hypothetical protein